MPKVCPKNPRKSKREDILAAAMRVFCHHGYDAATYELIAEEAGVSKALIIKHHGTKEEIVVICLERFLSSFLRSMRRSAHKAGTTYSEHMERMFRHFRRNRDTWRFVLTIWLTPAHKPIAAQVFPHYLQSMSDSIAPFQDKVDPVEHLALAYLMGSINVAYVLGGSEENYRNACDVILPKFMT